MKPIARAALALLATSSLLTACGGGGDGTREEPLNTDYSSLRIASAREANLVPAANESALLNPLKNGVRLSLNPGPIVAVNGLTAPLANGDSVYSGTTVQVEGVDEADLVKYDGQHMFVVHPEPVPAHPGMTRNVLVIAKTQPADATLEVLTEFTLAGEQSTTPLLYQLQNASGAAEYLAAVSQDYQGWASPQPQALVVLPDRTRIQLLDVRDPHNVSQAWQLELDGWLRGSRRIGDTLYLVNSYRPRLAGLELPADSQQKKEANERRIRNASTAELLPKYRINGSTQQSLATASDCVIAADLASNEAYTDLFVITAVDLRQQRVTDVSCLSTNINGLYVSTNSLYVGAEGLPSAPNIPFTVLHKFALSGGNVTYRATGVIGGRVGWLNASYFMGEHEGDLRIVTSEPSASGNDIHRLSILEETVNQRLTRTAMIPNPDRPQPIGKPGERVHAVRFIGDRAYVVTARVTDPLYVIDVSDRTSPFIVGELEIPGVSTFLQPIGPEGNELLLSIGQQTDAMGLTQGVKVELFDVSNITSPRTLGTRIFGERGSWSDAINDPHALTLLSRTNGLSHRVALPINVYATPHPSQAERFVWTYTGLHVFEIDATNPSAPTLTLRDVIRTDESSGPESLPPYVIPNRSVLHDDAVYGIHGDSFVSKLIVH